jgi:hypothetical protein
VLTIVDGPDGGGKSTWTRWYTARGRQQVYDHGPYPGEELIAPHYWESMIPARDWPVVMDRCWVAEPIYGAAFRGGMNRITTAHRRMLERAALAVRGVVALFLPPYEICRLAFLARKGDEYLASTEELAAVYDGYLGLIRGATNVNGRWLHLPMSLPYVVADWTRHTPRQISALIESVRGLPNEGPGTGRWAPDETVVLVGDRPGTTPGPGWSPFTTWNDRGCSAWLADVLEAAEIPESALYWVNAFSADGRATPHEWLATLQPRTVITLGREAAAWLQKWDGHRTLRAIDEVEHPQFWKRFHHRDPYPLVDALQDALTKGDAA